METAKKHKHKVFIEGPVTPEMIAASIAKHNNKLNIGAHSLFLGQVRNDKIDGTEVKAIEYTTYTGMAEEKILQIREETFQKYPIICMHIFHSLGIVKAGEISLMVFTSSEHRKVAIDACEDVVERIKKEVPVWGKEIFDDNNSQWKVNK